MNNSIGKRSRRQQHHQAAKPHKDFPLTAHPSARWCAKVKGKIHLFGKIVANDPRQSKKVVRLNRAEQGVKISEADELRRMIDAAIQPVKAMILLATNAGLGNNDIGPMRMNGITFYCDSRCRSEYWAGAFVARRGCVCVRDESA